MTSRFIGVIAVATVLVCWAGTALAQPFAGGLPQCRRQLSACQAAAQAFPATRQTTCWNSAGQVISCAGTGQDGDIQAGATLSYTDNGDGTITDNNTKLVWEKKSADGTIHDVNTLYTWDNAFAVHIGGLNAANFAGHNDWRLPNVKELQSIVNYEVNANVTPAVSPTFNTGCTAGATVLTGSCTAASNHWSSTTLANSPSVAWIVDFTGDVGAANKFNPARIRAVRSGSNLGSP